MNRFKVLGVCQGQGALLFPFRKNLIGNIEPRGCFHTPKEEQWKLNFGSIPFKRSYSEVPNFMSADIIIGSPNCGSSSILSFSRRKSFGKPKEDESIKMFISIVTMVRPKLFLMENLPKLLDFIPVEEWEKLFPDYNFLFHNNPVSDYGNSQKSRIRLTLIGVKKGQSRIKLNSFTKVFQVNVIKTTRELLEDKRLDDKYLPGNGNIRELPSHKVCMYDWRDKDKTKLSLSDIERLWVNDFPDCYKWPINSKTMKTLPGVYRNNSDRMPMTARKADRQFRPDGVIMSPAELAVIQGYPLKYKIFCMDTDDSKVRNYWINKGRITVTKGPSYEVGIWLKKSLKRN